MPATLRSLLSVDTFSLRLVSPTGAAQLDRPIPWVHSSDLPDPTPWLEPGQLLLTDGGQFSTPVDEAAADDYCARLTELDVAGLGFATDVIHPGIPDALISACARHSLPLVEVAHRTPFISIIRHVADLEAADRSAQLSWSLEAQRAVARAAVRKDGLREILRTLSQRMQTWVALYDASGSRVKVPGLPELPTDALTRLTADVRMLLDKGTPASLRTVEPGSATLQTIGQAHRLRGVLAVGTEGPLAPAQHDLVGSVIALASIALEQQRAVDDSRRHIRTGILELLVAGRLREANRTAKAVWGALPEAPFHVGGIAGPVRGQSVLDELELLASSAGSGLFFAERGSNVVILVADSAIPLLEPLVQRQDLRLGLSSRVRWAELDRGIEEALHAAAIASAAGVTRFEDIAGDGVMGALRSGGGAVLAAHLRARLDTLPAADRERLWSAARAWLDANTAWDPAARALGIHRHTLRARIDQLGELLGIDLGTFGARAELWAAMEFAGRNVGRGGDSGD